MTDFQFNFQKFKWQFFIDFFSVSDDFFCPFFGRFCVQFSTIYEFGSMIEFSVDFFIDLSSIFGDFLSVSDDFFVPFSDGFRFNFQPFLGLVR